MDSFKWISKRDRVGTFNPIFNLGSLMPETHSPRRMFPSLSSSFSSKHRKSTLLVLAITTFAFSGGCDKAKTAEAAPPEVEVVEVTQKDVPITVQWVATLTGKVNAQIRAQVAGSGGVAFKLDTSRAEAAQAASAANIPEFERQIALQENVISVLLGSNPHPIVHTAKLLDEIVPPDIPVGLPSALLERRPDVLAAEQQVRAANAQVGVAIANFFPQIGLTALLGQASTPLSRITAGSANVWSIAGNFTGPIYQGGALTAQKRQAVAFWQQTKLQYEQTALNAFTDVSNALISRQKFEATRIEQARSVAAYQQAVTVSLQRYTAGRASYFEVLDAQQQLYPQQTFLAQTELNRRLVIVQLYLALGGGWNLTDSDWQKHTVTAANPATSHP
jgi:NodT family efflux transporter outer membrane factor (OMF) lipoprotein